MEIFCEPPIFVKANSKDVLLLTNLDQMRDYYRSIILVYRSNDKELGEATDPAAAARHGLEEMVAHYYPWAAGRIRTVVHSDGCRLEVCFNEDGGPGAQFISARANCALAHLGDLGDPNPAFELLFANVNMEAPLRSRPLVVLQVTRFQDGGVCVSMTFNHALFDGAAASIFLRNTSLCARGEAGLCTQLDKAPRELRIKPVMVPLQQGWPCYLHEIFTKDLSAEQQQLPATRFSFSKEALSKLQSEALSKQQDCGIGFKACSRFRALAAHLWKAKAKSLHKFIDPSQAFRLRVAVNVRRRIVASIPLNYMGNAFALVEASATMEELREKSLAFAVEKIQEAIKQVNSEHFQSQVDFIQMLGCSAHTSNVDMAITSVAGLGFHEADFGWGKPAYVGRPHKQRSSLFIISDGNAHYTSLDVRAVFKSRVELHKFQDALYL